MSAITKHILNKPPIDTTASYPFIQVAAEFTCPSYIRLTDVNVRIRLLDLLSMVKAAPPYGLIGPSGDSYVCGPLLGIIIFVMGFMLLLNISYAILLSGACKNILS